MNELASYLTNYTSPSGGFSYGQFKDDPGDGSGSGAVVKTINDLWYGMESLAFKYMGGISDTDESETASDIMDSVETAIGVLNPNVSEYNNGTTYAQDDIVMRYGSQFVSMVGSNTGNDPFTNPEKWIPCHTRDEALRIWQKGDDIKGGFDIVHNYRDAGYRQNFRWGKYNYGGDSGVNYEAFGVHLDGVAVTGNPTLVSIFDVGGGGEYHLLDVIAPDVVGTRTLLDAKGRVGAVVDAGGGNRVAVGAVQEDNLQGFSMNIVNGVGTAWQILNNRTTGGAASGVDLVGGSDNIKATGFTSDGAHGTPRIGLETQMKNYSVGIPSVLVLNAI